MSPSTAAPQAARTDLVVDAAGHRRRAWFLLGFAAWNVWLWGTRLANLFSADETHSTAFVVVHTILFVVSLGGSALLARTGWTMHREARRALATVLPGEDAP